MNKEQIEQQVVVILREKLDCGDGLFAIEYRDAPLTWRPFNFTAVQLTYLFLEIEKAFEIKIPEYHLACYGFSTISRIVEVLGEMLLGDI